MLRSIVCPALQRQNAHAFEKNPTGERPMPALSSHKVLAARMSSKDRELENLLERAADFFKNRPSPAGRGKAEKGESRQEEEATFDAPDKPE